MSAEESSFVRTYAVTGGRSQPRHPLALETTLEAGRGRSGPDQVEECRQIIALCRERQRTVAELAGRLGRPVTAVKVLLSDLLDADALVLPVTAPYSSSDDGKDPQLLTAVVVGLRKKFQNATAYPQAG
ncbi:DUF742 domain-containing protein [Streptomyces anthocyanicus]|uniref:DUF742 domain-containing protein n=1 Tax=Streptomyces anthocyanicus TaxID=68174 RepID=UPI003817A43B